jgi:hypothetical protein
MMLSSLGWMKRVCAMGFLSFSFSFISPEYQEMADRLARG